MTSAAVRSKLMVVLLLLIQYLLLLSLFVGCSVFGPCFAMQCLVSFLVCNHLDEEERERAGCFTVFLIACDY